MTTPFSGGCACGAIRYECSAESVTSLNCHCRDCQRGSGSAYAALLSVPVAAFTPMKGDPKFYRVTADSQYPVDRGFCPECGSAVFLKVQRMWDLGFAYLLAASLDDPSWVRPVVDLWTSSAQPWDYMNPTLPKFERGLTEEQVKKLIVSR